MRRAPSGRTMLHMPTATSRAKTPGKGLSGISLAQSLADESVALVRTWLDRAATLHRSPDASSERLAGVLKDPKGPAFALGFVDRVARPRTSLLRHETFVLCPGISPIFCRPFFVC